MITKGWPIIPFLLPINMYSHHSQRVQWIILIIRELSFVIIVEYQRQKLRTFKRIRSNYFQWLFFIQFTSNNHTYIIKKNYAVEKIRHNFILKKNESTNQWTITVVKLTAYLEYLYILPIISFAFYTLFLSRITFAPKKKLIKIWLTFICTFSFRKIIRSFAQTDDVITQSITLVFKLKA